MIYDVKYAIGTKVFLEGQKDLLVTITSISLYGKGDSFYPTYTVEWLHNGTNQSATSVPEYRLVTE
jgi:hypothetical protein